MSDQQNDPPAPREDERAPENQPATSEEPENHERGRHSWARRIILGMLAVAAVAAGIYYGIPWVESYFTYVSTDDAYVAGHMTYLGPRISSQVKEVKVDEDDYVAAGEVLLRLDPEPFQLAVDQAQAALGLAQANLAKSRAGVRAALATARGDQYQVQSTIEQLRYQVASLKAAVAELKLDEAKLTLAEKNFERESKLYQQNVEPQENYQQSLANLQVARNQVAAQSENVQRTRAELGLTRNTEDPTQVPDNIERIYPQVQVALSNWATTLIQIGVPVDVVGLSAEVVRKQLDDWISKQISQEELDKVVENAPDVQVAQASVREAQAELDRAKLDLSYTDIKAPFDGFVTKRSVNPGDYVTPGQNLLLVQSLEDVWIDANFKETQIDNLVIGMPVEVHVDAYPGKTFAAHVAGFSGSTGSKLSLLPPENATGNFVKVVQRLPVRIEFEKPPPPETPLFVGLSVEPNVRYKARPQGPHAGERLRLPKSESTE